MNEFYTRYRENDWSYIVEKQSDSHIDVIEHGDYVFDKENSEKDGNYFIVYTWGDSTYPLSDLDLRGH